MGAMASQIISLTIVRSLNRLFRHISKKTSKLRVTGLCAGNSPVTGEFPAQMAGYAEYASIWWRHHDLTTTKQDKAKLYVCLMVYTVHVIYISVQLGWRFNAFTIVKRL